MAPKVLTGGSTYLLCELAKKFKATVLATKKIYWTIIYQIHAKASTNIFFKQQNRRQKSLYNIQIVTFMFCITYQISFGF